MAALKNIARDVAAEIRDGIGWVIVYRTGRSWHSVTLWSDVEAGEWETDDIKEALDVLKVDPKAVLLNGYYCGYLGEDMTIDEIAAGIKCHYEGECNQLADNDVISNARGAAEGAQLGPDEDETTSCICDDATATEDHDTAQKEGDFYKHAKRDRARKEYRKHSTAFASAVQVATGGDTS